MQRKKTTFLLIFLLLVFVRSEAFAIPYEYSISGTAGYWTTDNQMVFWGQPITGSFVLNDPVVAQPFDSLHYNYSLSDMYISGGSFLLSGAGNIHVLFPGGFGWGEPDMNLTLGGYTSYADNFPGWEYRSFFYNENGSIDLSFADDPHTITFYGSLYSGPGMTGDRYYLNVTASRGASVPEPSTMLLLVSGLIGIFGVRKKLGIKN